MLRRLLDKRKAAPLLAAFLAGTPEVVACWVVDSEGQSVLGSADHLAGDLCALAADLRAAREPFNLAPYSVAPLFLHQDLVGGIVVQHQGPAVHLSPALPLLSAALTQLVVCGEERKDILLDTLEKYREITLLYTIAEAIGACLEVDQIARLVLETSHKMIKAEQRSVMLLHPQTRKLEIRAASGVEQALKVPLREGVGIAGRVVQTGQPEIVNDPQADPQFVHRTGSIRTLLCVPLKTNDKILGVINVSNKLSGEMFTAGDEKLLLTLASQASIAIDNARLVTELKENNRALEAALQKVELLEQVKGHLSKFVPQSVQKLIDANPHAPELEKQDKDVSILFLDIAGYTQISEALDQSKVNYLIERYFSSFLDDIHQNHGDINETAGDGLMIIFQDPDTTLHALQAARTALAIHNKTRQINADLDGVYASVLVNIGINCGVASVGSTKFEGISGIRWTYTASGPVTNLASRLAAFAASGDVLLSPELARRIAPQFVVQDLGWQRFKNISEPVQVYRLLAERPAEDLGGALWHKESVGEEHDEKSADCRR
jgi:class 3 adenylate cyclase